MWTEKNNALHLTVEGETFEDAKAFVLDVLDLAEEHNHHPTLENTYSTVKLLLTTHDAGNTVTQKDRALAEDIAKLVEQNNSLTKQ